MDDTILAISCVCNDLLKGLHHAEDRQQKLTAAEILTTALVAMLCFGGNFEQARARLNAGQYMPTLRSRSRFNRRLPQIDELFATLVDVLGQTWTDLNVESVYSMDSLPVALGDHDRLPRAQVYQQEA